MKWGDITPLCAGSDRESPGTRSRDVTESYLSLTAQVASLLVVTLRDDVKPSWSSTSGEGVGFDAGRPYSGDYSSGAERRDQDLRKTF